MRLGLAVLGATLNTTARLAPGLAARGALRLFRRPRSRVPVRPAEESTLAAAEHERLTVAGVPVAVYRWGDSPRPVLLVHGWQYRASRFAPLVEALRRRGHAVVAFDLPGHGASGGTGSDLPEVRRIIGELERHHGPFSTVLGHSFGGLAAWYTLAEGMAADRLVMVGAPGDFGEVLDGFCAHLGLRPRVNLALRQLIERRYFPGTVDALSTLSVHHRPERLAVPLMVVHDEEDRVVPVAQGRTVHAAYAARADALFTQGLGHNRILADPEVIEALTAFTAVTATGDPVR
ncbi:alpha/beta hydrolase [Streptomyces profundus]|uniref:alpha/beta hydrolase n=1 Tax=Streptomyces profundus TaxID=2867410 RepID=UPI001D15F5F1|nr:alpha/beta hydrolase [Streptomyces sp. MA3_2.13]UED88121.1 alpha/beta hydrolase [Streptomyces sp. MA3_2.13]